MKDQLVSIAATLDHCHVPGRTEHANLDATTIEIGTGPHNEPVSSWHRFLSISTNLCFKGYKKISPVPAPEDLVKTLVAYLTDLSDPDRAYINLEQGDEVVVLVNNFGGMSVLEMGALTDEFLNQIPLHIKPVRIYTGMFETSLNAPAFSLTLCNLTATAKKAGFEVSELLGFLDARTDSAWEAVAGSQTQRRPRRSQIVDSPIKAVPELPEIKELFGNTWGAKS